MDTLPYGDHLPWLSDLNYDAATSFSFSALPSITPSVNASIEAHVNENLPNTLSWGSNGLEIHSGVFIHLSDTTAQWMLSAPTMSKFDRAIMNHFINIFMRRVSSTFISFVEFRIQESTTEEELLAIAAVGGLYSRTSGSQIIARAMLDDSRRLFITRVSISLPQS